MSCPHRSLCASQSFHAYRVCRPFHPALWNHFHSRLEFLKREELLADLRALLMLAGELKRHLKLLTARSRRGDSFLLVGHFLAHLYGFDTCGEELAVSLGEQQALNLLTWCLIEKMKFHGSEEAFLRMISGFVVIGGGRLRLKWST
jgi:hypothetical protein